MAKGDKMQLQVEYVDISTIQPYKGNAKEHPKEQIEQIKKSMQEFGNIDPIGIWHNEIVEGHGRYLALKELGETQIPVIRLDDLTDEQRRAYTLVHNQLTMNSGFDLDTLKVELDNIGEIDMSEFGFNLDGSVEDETYTRKIEPPTYEPTEETAPGIDELCDKSKYDDLVRYIDNADIPQDIADFLKLTATRHIVYDYGSIAEFYAHQPKEIQELMEASALVIIDYDKAVANGFVKLTNELEALFGGDSDEE